MPKQNARKQPGADADAHAASEVDCDIDKHRPILGEYRCAQRLAVEKMRVLPDSSQTMRVEFQASAVLPVAVLAYAAQRLAIVALCFKWDVVTNGGRPGCQHVLARIPQNVPESSHAQNKMVLNDELILFCLVCTIPGRFTHLAQLLANILGRINGHALVPPDGNPRHVGHFAHAVSGAFQVPTTVLEVLNDLLQNCSVVQRVCIYSGGAGAARPQWQLLFRLQSRVPLGRAARVCCLAFLADLNSEKVSADGARLRVGSGGRRYGVDRSQKPCRGYEEHEGR